jgi:hypothetical protein
MNSQKGKQNPGEFPKCPILTDRKVGHNSNPIIDLRFDSLGPISWKISLVRLRRFLSAVANLGAIRRSKFWELGYAPEFVSSEKP